MSRPGMYVVEPDPERSYNPRRVLCPFHARQPLSDGWKWVNDADCRWDGENDEPCTYCGDDDDDIDDDGIDGIVGPRCELHNAPHLMGGLACELRSAENLLS